MLLSAYTHTHAHQGEELLEVLDTVGRTHHAMVAIASLLPLQAPGQEYVDPCVRVE